MVLGHLTLVAGGLSTGFELVADRISDFRKFEVIGEPAFVEAGAHKVFYPPSGLETMLLDLRLSIDAVGNAENDIAVAGHLSQSHPAGLCGLVSNVIQATGLADEVAVGNPCSQLPLCEGAECEIFRWLPTMLCQSFCGNCNGLHGPSCDISCQMRNGRCITEVIASGGSVDFVASTGAGSRITWEARWDVFVPLRILLGLVLLKGAQRTAKSFIMQSLVGVVIGLVFVLLIAWEQGDVEDQDVAELSAAFARGPLFVTAQGYEVVSSALHRVLAWQDPNYGFPQGHAFLIGACIAGAMSGIRLLRDGQVPAEVDSVGEVIFTIGRDGRRVDKLPSAAVPMLQSVFKAMLWMVGASLLLTATAWPIANVFTIVVVITWGWMGHLISCMVHWNRSSQPGKYTELISAEEVEMQMENATAQALHALREYIARNPAAMAKVSPTAYDGLKRMVTDPSMKVSALCYDEGHDYEESRGWLRSCNVL